MQVVKGHQGPAIVLEAGIDSQQPHLVGEVAQPPGQGVLTAIYCAGIHKRSERVDLVANGDVAPSACWAGAEEGNAILLVLDSRVIRWDLWHTERLAWLLQVGCEWLLPVKRTLTPPTCREASQGPIELMGLLQQR